ncbi:hypothetical protein H6F77_13205 [Microcoleus sp. FACHB-831]|jgi:hypothetical protein|uniref:hypothetical protein n=1 Tax=Microcoleus sp. FACHB-831 TaxID=2692827 RepID=UPI00168A20A0|nr:hypothetical protein [Microcoleus sp. FACHB-831]MBD1922041.1 hypothetical protein [Microcoleus sp. FACHB-831]
MNKPVIYQLVEQIFAIGKITQLNCKQLKIALLDARISDEDLNLIELVIEGVQKGQLNVVR